MDDQLQNSVQLLVHMLQNEYLEKERKIFHLIYVKFRISNGSINGRKRRLLFDCTYYA